MNRGLLYALICYGAWGVLPIYWKALHDVPAPEILVYRVLWTWLALVLVLGIRRRWSWLHEVASNRLTLATFLATSGLLFLNWLTYIWAVNAGFIVETSLGYFINPLVNVLLGRLFLGEQLRPGQRAAVGLALVGVLYLTWSYGRLPWIALTLAFTFAFYGLLRKTARLDALEGLSLEMGLGLLPALAYLALLFHRGQAASATAGTSTWILLVGLGLITAVPLVSFSAAARRLTLTTLGLMQYMAPTLQFLIGVFLYQEPFGPSQLVGFTLIWIALALYTGESLHHHRRPGPGPAPKGLVASD